MSGSVISKLSIEVEAQQSKLDRDLDQVEKKAKSTGSKAEESLSLGGVASKLVGVFAALGTIEAGFRGLTSITSLLDGDLAGALDSLERMPFGIGPAVGAARDFFEVISGSREQAEQLASEWAKVAGEINNAQNEVKALIEAQANAGKDDIDRSNDRASRFNELLRERTKLINEIADVQAREASSTFQFGERDPDAAFAKAGDTELSDELQQKLKDIGFEAKTATEAINQLRAANDEAFSAGIAARMDDMRAALQRVADIEQQTRVDNLQSQGTSRDADLDIKRIKVEQDRDKQLVDARSALEKKSIQEQFELRMRLIEDEAAARRQADQDAAFERERQAFQENQRLRELAEQRAERELKLAEEKQKKAAEQAERDRFIEGKGMAADEFLRTNFAGGEAGKVQEVKDPEAVGALNEANAILDQIARNTKNLSATLA